jgi:two-component system response regulator LytT
VISIGLCDDNRDNRQSLRWLLESILEEKQMEYHIFEFSSGETLMQWDQKHPNEIDLIFLDIEMGQLNGMETARQLRQRHSALQIVFVTGFSEYVFDGYRVGALGYLMKPAKRDQLEELISLFLAKVCQTAQEVYSCRDGDSWFRIPHQEILYFESERRKIHCVTQTRTYSFYGKLDEVAQELEQAGFVRIHQRYLVRIGAIRQLCGSQVQVGETTLPISRSCHAAAMVALTKATLGV